MIGCPSGTCVVSGDDWRMVRSPHWKRLVQPVQYSGRVAKRRHEQQNKTRHRGQSTEQEAQQIGLSFRFSPQAVWRDAAF